MFGMAEALLSFLRRQVGLRTDAASDTGSLHAKVKTANDRIGAANPSAAGTDTLFKYDKKIFDRLDERYDPFSYAGSLVVDGWTTVRNITGRSGFLLSAGCLNSMQGQTYHTRVTIDGIVVFNTYSFGSDSGPTGIMYTPAELLRSDYAYDPSGSGYPTTYNYPLWQAGGRFAARLDGTSLNFNPTFPSSSSQYNAVLLNTMPIRFNNSLKIEHAIASGQASATISVVHTGALVRQ
jgi:hypothetical protein